MTQHIQREHSSFRDPSGVVFYHEGRVYRQINSCYEKQYEHFVDCGLYKKLIDSSCLVPHEEVDLPVSADADKGPVRQAQGRPAYKVIKPLEIPMISYPYEWCFGQLRDAALLTLRIHRLALDHGMILKDASSYNVQFLNGAPVFIDTLSFDFYEDGTPWVAYGQFCRHFLAPLFLMAHKDMRLSQLLRVYVDGIPLDLASCLLGWKGGFGGLQHIHLHAKAVTKYGEAGHDGDKAKNRPIRISKFQHTALIDALIRLVEKTSSREQFTEWGDYYKHTNYSDQSAGKKSEAVSRFLEQCNARREVKVVWDFGANDGTYSRLALRNKNVQVVAFDIDANAVGRNYAAVKKSGEAMLPLLLDLTNPSPAIGFGNRERVPIEGRGKPDCILSLALIHHLAISNNVPLPHLAEWYAGLCEYLIIEFVPKEDSQVKKLLATRVDIFPSYTRDGFEAAFGEYHEMIAREDLEGTQRSLYLWTAKKRPS